MTIEKFLQTRFQRDAEPALIWGDAEFNIALTRGQTTTLETSEFAPETPTRRFLEQLDTIFGGLLANMNIDEDGNITNIVVDDGGCVTIRV